MSFQFLLPDIGEGVVEAEIQKWLVGPGDEVTEDQALVEVMTDKAAVTLRSPKPGRVTRLLYGEGEVARVQSPLLEMDLGGPVGEAQAPTDSGLPDGLPPKLEPRPEGTNGTPAGGRALATPAVRAMAREMGIDLTLVAGTGPGGRVTKQDVARKLRDRESPPQVVVPEPPRAHQVEPTGVDGSSDVIPFRGMRRTIAERMVLSHRTAVHFTFVEQVDATELVKLKEKVAAAAKEEGVKLTFLPFFVKATVAALKKHPRLNATLEEAKGEIRVKHWYHIGIASATPNGLTVPVVRHADRRSLLDTAREIERLSEATKTGKARPEDLQGSTFTITSLGAAGGLFATPIINPPEVAILGVHRIRPTPVVRDGQVVPRDVMHISLSFDHRVIDGDVAAAFSYTLIGYLEDPSLLFMELV